MTIHWELKNNKKFSGGDNLLAAAVMGAAVVIPILTTHSANKDEPIKSNHNSPLPSAEVARLGSMSMPEC